jgi:hypothetical protein
MTICRRELLSAQSAITRLLRTGVPCFSRAGDGLPGIRRLACVNRGRCSVRPSGWPRKRGRKAIGGIIRDQRTPTIKTISDFVFLKSTGIRIDAQDFAETLAYENKHRDFSACSGCRAKTYEQHQPSCPHVSNLFEANWYDELRRREEDRFSVEDCEFLPQCGILVE